MLKKKYRFSPFLKGGGLALSVSGVFLIAFGFLLCSCADTERDASPLTSASEERAKEIEISHVEINQSLSKVRCFVKVQPGEGVYAIYGGQQAELERYGLIPDRLLHLVSTLGDVFVFEFGFSASADKRGEQVASVFSETENGRLVDRASRSIYVLSGKTLFSSGQAQVELSEDRDAMLIRFAERGKPFGLDGFYPYYEYKFCIDASLEGLKRKTPVSPQAKNWRWILHNEHILGSDSDDVEMGAN